MLTCFATGVSLTVQVIGFTMLRINILTFDMHLCVLLIIIVELSYSEVEHEQQ